VRAILQRVQQYRFAGQLFEFAAEPIDLRAAGGRARPGGADVNQDVVQVPADRYRVDLGRWWYLLVDRGGDHRGCDLLDAPFREREDLRVGGHRGLFGPGRLDVARVGATPA